MAASGPQIQPHHHLHCWKPTGKLCEEQSPASNVAHLLQPLWMGPQAWNSHRVFVHRKQSLISPVSEATCSSCPLILVLVLQPRIEPICDNTEVLASLHAQHDAGWQYVGSFINGKSKPLRDHDLGAMWECPFLTALQEPASAQRSSEVSGDPARQPTLREDRLYMMCVSPYPHHLKDRLTNPCLYWLGHLQQGLFMIAESDGQLLFMTLAWRVALLVTALLLFNVTLLHT